MADRSTTARLSFYAGLGLVTAATLMLQIVETRIVSVTSWYHLAFFVISIAMFGLTGGAVYVYLKRDRFRPETLAADLCAASLACAVGAVLALVVQLTIVTSLSVTLMAFLVWTQFAVALTIPFFFSGIVVSLALTRSPYPIGIVYGVDLLGAALGCLGALVIMSLVSGPSAVLWVAVVIAGGGLLFAASGLGEAAGSGWSGALFRWRWPVFAGLVVIAGLNSALPLGIRPTVVKETLERPQSIAYERWNSFSRVTLNHPSRESPAMWGPSPRTPPSTIEQRWLNMDGGAGTATYRFTGDLGELDFLRYDISNLAYAVPDLKTGAVIGVGGGRDVLSQKLFGIEQVTGVEINPIFIDILTNRYADYTAIARQPGVSLVVDEARSWFARTDKRFDVIQMSLIDTWAATGAGAFTLSENGLYTIDAWKIFLDRLTPKGIFTVSRWYAPGEVNETGRMMALATATLQALGSDDPKSHFFVAATGQIATLVMAREPLTPQALAALTEAAGRYDYRILVSPDRPSASPLLESIVGSRDGAALHAVTKDAFLDLSPPTDGRPFFFNQLRLDRLGDLDLTDLGARTGVYGGNLIATLTLAMLILISLVLVLATIVFPLRATVERPGSALVLAGTAYFALIGTGFMLAEIALLQRISVFLGHPVYALSVVLFSLIVSTGIGSLVSERFPLDTPGRLVGWAVLTAAYVFTLPWWLPDLLIGLESSGLVARAGLAIAVLAPAGFLMGFGFPTGMRLVSAIDTGPTPWFWGINGAAGVLAASVAVIVSIAFGIDTTLRAGALCYLILALPALGLLRAASPRPAVGVAPAPVGP